MPESPCQLMDGTGLFWLFMVTFDKSFWLKVDTLQLR
jgi:hypothetical protein